MVAILEVYTLECTECGKSDRVRRLHVHGNLAELERTHVCRACQKEARSQGADGDGD